MWFRLISLCVLLIGAFTLPFWVTVILGVLAIIRFPNFFEIVIVGLFIDALYGVPLVRFFNIPLFCTITSTLLVLLSVWLRTAMFSEKYNHI